jgi:lipopolysaccharide export system protein LptA
MTVNATGIAIAGLLLLAVTTGAQAQGALLPGGNSKEPVSINSDKLDYFDKEQKLVYSGGVFAKQGDSTLKASTLSIFLASNPTKGSTDAGAAAGGNDVRRMEASGPVVISSKDQVGMGDRAIYDKAENKLYLIGNVSLSQEGNVIKGQAKSRLVYDLTAGQAQIEGGVTSLFTPKGSGAAASPAAGADGLRRAPAGRDGKETGHRRQ